MLLLLAIIFFCCYVSSLAFTCAKYHRYPTCIYDNNIEKSLENARKNIIERKSPGAGLATADEQADAAYADLINTTMEQRGIENLSSEELDQLDKGGTMWEKDAKTTVNKLGLLGDIFNAIKALSGGAHITKNKFGET